LSFLRRQESRTHWNNKGTLLSGAADSTPEVPFIKRFSYDSRITSHETRLWAKS
jgi:hypothetical protein